MNSLITFHEEKMKKSLTIVIDSKNAFFPRTKKSPCPAPTGEDKGLPHFWPESWPQHGTRLAVKPNPIRREAASRSASLEDALQLMALQQLQQFPAQFRR